MHLSPRTLLSSEKRHTAAVWLCVTTWPNLRGSMLREWVYLKGYIVCYAFDSTFLKQNCNAGDQSVGARVGWRRVTIKGGHKGGFGGDGLVCLPACGGGYTNLYIG